jgi:hypothetical protein
LEAVQWAKQKASSASQSPVEGDSGLFGVWASRLQELQEIWDLVRQALPEIAEAWIASACKANGVWGRNEDFRASNLISTGAAGGGNIGDKLAHSNEAPFPEELVDFFVASLCPPGGLTLDPFSGSATVSRVCEKLGRSSLGFDLRRNQAVLGQRRLEAVAR